MIMLYVIYLFFTRIFNAKVKFRSGFSFFSIQDISIDSEEFEIRCKLFMISIGVHTNMQLRNLQITKGDISHLKDVYIDAQRIVDRALPSKRFFHISIDVDIVDYKTEYFSLTMENIHSIHTDSQHSFSYRSCTFSSSEVSGKVTEYQHSIHFSGDLPEKVQIVRPMFNLKCDTNTISTEYLEISAYSEKPTIWRTVISVQAAELTFPNFVFLNDIFIIKFSHQITISIPESLITFESLHIKNILHQFKIKINQVKLSHDKIKIKKIIGNSHVQFLRILNHLRWLLYASCKIKKIELLIKLDNGELCDIVVLNFDERNKIDDDNEDKNENRRISEINDDSEETNLRYFNLFNRYFNSLNKHNIQLNEGEALITNPNDITNGFHPHNIHENHQNNVFDRIKKEFAKADEVKMEMIAHRTLISSVHMSNIQINRKNVSQFQLDTLNIIYSNSETFQLYCQELYTGFSGKLTTRDHNIQAIVKSLRINELIRNQTLISDNLGLKLLINKSVPLEESRKSLKSLFPKLADPSKIQSVILLDYDIKCSEMSLTNSFTASPINFTGNMALFHNGSKLLTCGVVHCVSDKAKIPIESFISPPFWYISFESNTFKIKYDNQKVVFRSIKGEATAFTFESAALYRNIIQPKLQRNLQSTTNSNLNNEMTNEDYQFNENKSISIFDFWNEEVIPIGVKQQISKAALSPLQSQLSLANESMNSLVTGSNINLTSDTNMNLNLINNSYQAIPIIVPKKILTDGVNVSGSSKRVSCQFDYEDSVFRPSQHQENQSIYQSREKVTNVNSRNRQTAKFPQPRNSVFISPKLTSEFVTGSLFESSASMINFTSNLSNLINKKTKVSSFDDDLVFESSDTDNSPLADGMKRESSMTNIQIDELKGDSPFYETVRYKFEAFNGEYFTNSNEKEKTVELKFEKAIFGDIQYTNVTSKFVNQEAVSFCADQIEWPYMKAFFADFKLKDRLFTAKSMSLNSNFIISLFDHKIIGFSEAEIGQILFKELSFDKNTIINPSVNKNGSNMNSKSSILYMKSEKITMNKGKFSFYATEVEIPITTSKAEITANKVRVIFSTVSSLISFLSDMKNQFKKISSKTFIMKLRPTFSRINSNNKNYLNHSIVFYTNEISFNPLSGQLNVFDIYSDVVTIFRVNKKVPQKNDPKEDANDSKNQNNDGNNNNNKKDKNREKTEIFASRPDEERDQSNLKKDEKDRFHITLTFNEKEKVCPRFNISLNSKVFVKCTPKDAELFKEAFEAIFLLSPHEEIKKYVFESTSFLRLTLILNYYDPNDSDFDEKRKYTLDIRPIEIHKQTKTFHDMIRFIFDSVLKSVKTKVAEKKREIQMNGNNY